MRTLIKTLVLGVALTFAAPLAFGDTPAPPKKARKVKAAKKKTKKVTKKAKKATKKTTKRVKKAKGE